MDMNQLSHLPRLHSLSEVSYLVHEQASLTGRLNVEPITLGIIGLYHQAADPRGLPNVEVYTPMESIDYLVYTGSKHAVGDSIPASETRQVYLSDVYSYQSDTVTAKARLSLREIIGHLGLRLRQSFKPATNP